MIQQYHYIFWIKGDKGKKMIKKANKKLNKIIIIVIVLILLFPIPIRYKDGGTVEYKAILYSVTDYHALREAESFETGIEIKILGITVYRNVKFGQ